MISEKRVLQRGAVAGDDDGLAAVLAIELRGLDGLVFLRLLIGVLDQRFHGEHLLVQLTRARGSASG